MNNLDVQQLMSKLQHGEDVDLPTEYLELVRFAQIKKRFTAPRIASNRSFSKLINWFLIKVFHMMFKMLDPVFDSQEQFNMKVIEKLIEMEKNKGVRD